MINSISIVIPTYNSAQTIARCVQGLREQTVTPMEIIFVDNGSSDETVSMLESLSQDLACPVHVLSESKPGAAAARNTGVQAAQGEWLAFTDSDCIPESDWIEKGLKVMAEQGCDAMAGPAWGTMEGDLSAKLLSLTTLSVGCEAHWRKDAGDTGVNGFATANFWVKKNAFEQVEGFDESLSVSGEDYDFCARLYQAGTAIYYSPQLSVRHIHPTGVKTLFVKAMAYGQAHGTLFEKYGKQGIYLDWFGGRRKRFSSSRKIWINMVSAEKKMMVLFVLAWLSPVLSPLILFYPLLLSRFLRQRALALEYAMDLPQAYLMGWLLILRSLAFTLGRIKGSKPRVWVL